LAARFGLLKTPPEVDPPLEVKELSEALKTPEPDSPISLSPEKGFIRAAVLPETLALHLKVANPKRRPGAERRAALSALREKALAYGPESLTAKEKKAILNDPRELVALHWAIWRLEGEKARLWGLD
jgi:membrane glycosyltransferase